MKSLKRTSFLVSLLVAVGITTASADERLAGAWIVSSWEPLGEENIGDPQPGIFIFTSTNYAIMYVNTADERPAYDQEAGMSDAEKMAAYDSLTANAGGYEVEGNTFTTYSYVAKDTNYMGDFPANGTEYEFARNGDTLTITSKTFPQNFKAVLERVEGEDGPWETAAE